MKLSRRQKRILKRKLKRIAGDAVAVLVGAGMFVGLLIAWANEPMPDWSEYIEENHIGMVQVEGSDTWLTQEEYEQMCKERDAGQQSRQRNNPITTQSFRALRHQYRQRPQQSAVWTGMQMTPTD